MCENKSLWPRQLTIAFSVYLNFAYFVITNEQLTYNFVIYHQHTHITLLFIIRYINRKLFNSTYWFRNVSNLPLPRYLELICYNVVLRNHVIATSSHLGVNVLYCLVVCETTTETVAAEWDYRKLRIYTEDLENPIVQKGRRMDTTALRAMFDNMFCLYSSVNAFLLCCFLN